MLKKNLDLFNVNIVNAVNILLILLTVLTLLTNNIIFTQKFKNYENNSKH